jgi:acetyl esterase
MSVDPEVAQFLEDLRKLGAPPLSSLSPTEARAGMAADAADLGPGEAVAAKVDRTVPGPAGPIPVRIYTPLGPNVRGLYVYYHGGGWVIGDVETHDAYCCSVANAAGCRVLSVDYRLAPEHKFPAAPDDCYVATAWAFENVRQLCGGAVEPIAVGGDSAGGNLAAVVSLMARDRGSFRPALQVLIYPVANHAFDTASYHENAEGYLLTRADMHWFWDCYLAHPADGRNPYASPLRAEDLAGLPPALVLTAGYDPLRDEGEAYAARLRAAGVPVKLVAYPGMIHAFIRRTRQFTQARAALAEVAAALREALR